MNGFMLWLRQTGEKIKNGFLRFMTGRYGTDKLNMYILGAGVVACVLAMLIPGVVVDLVLSVLSYGLLIWALCRSFSRNTYKRYEENRKFLRLLDMIKDREHRYFRCPKCKQSVRVPKGKGKIAITCPKCKEKFVKKT